MKITYLDNVELPENGLWKTNSLRDWMHPKHGPLPDHVGILGYQASPLFSHETFRVALWGTRNSTLAAVELIEKEEEHWTELPKTRGSILYTIRWTVDGNRIKCWNHHFPIPDKQQNEDRWRQTIAEKIMVESVRVAATTDIDGNKKAESSSILAVPRRY